MQVKFADVSSFFWSKTRQNVSLIFIQYHFMCIVTGFVSLKINDKEPYELIVQHFGN